MLSISLCTNKRPELFKKAILSISKLKIVDIDLDIIVVIIDNDENFSALDTFNELKSKIPFPCYYFHEKEKGITFARNRALLESVNLNAISLAFFDDDAEVDNMWLSNLYKVFNNKDKTIVTGPQLTKFPDDAPDWTRDIIYFNPKRRPTNQIMSWAATNNVIFPLSVYTEDNILFDNTLRYSGGSDQCFFMNCIKSGYKILWANNAIVTEYVPKERLTINWVKNRSYRYGSTGFYLQSQKNNHLISIFISLFKCSAYLFIGTFMVINPLNSELKNIEGRCYIQRGLGWLNGVFGKRHQEYIDR